MSWQDDHEEKHQNKWWVKRRKRLAEDEERGRVEAWERKKVEDERMKKRWKSRYACHICGSVPRPRAKPGSGPHRDFDTDSTYGDFEADYSRPPKLGEFYARCSRCRRIVCHLIVGRNCSILVEKFLGYQLGLDKKLLCKHCAGY